MVAPALQPAGAAYQICARKPGPVNIEHLAAIHEVEVARFSVAAKARATAKRVDKAIIASNIEVSMTEGSGFGALESEEEGYRLNQWYPLTHLLLSAEVEEIVTWKV